MLNRWLKQILIWLVRAYQLTLSPFIGGQCRFYPTCSQYALESLERHGGVTGAALSAKRVLRCHPGNPGGFDPVPEPDQP